jgi:hypothetical protein
MKHRSTYGPQLSTGKYPVIQPEPIEIIHRFIDNPGYAGSTLDQKFDRALWYILRGGLLLLVGVGVWEWCK